MRYINLDRLRTDAAVQPAIQAANIAREAILAEDDHDRRKAIIRDNRAIWVAFRDHFQRVFGIKCWYVECTNEGTDDDVDHYRPKGAVAESLAHEGYWWEAFQWQNYRLSCHRGNRLRVNPESGATGGKSDHFPLLDESQRCTLPTDDLKRERPALLDPIDPSDPPLLSFNMDGTVAVAAEYAADLDAIRRVDASRIYLHLEWHTFKKARQQLYAKVWEHVLRGDEFEAAAVRGDQVGRRSLKHAIDDLIEMSADSAPYSRAARAFIRTFRDRTWIRTVVIPNFASED